MKIRRFFIPILSILLLGLILAACGAPAATSAPTAPSSDSPKEALQSPSSVNTGQNPKMIEFYTDW